MNVYIRVLAAELAFEQGIRRKQMFSLLNMARQGEKKWFETLDVLLSILPVSLFAKVGGDDERRASMVLSSW